MEWDEVDLIALLVSGDDSLPRIAAACANGAWTLTFPNAVWYSVGLSIGFFIGRWEPSKSDG
jgi:hypothetical protein